MDTPTESRRDGRPSTPNSGSRNVRKSRNSCLLFGTFTTTVTSIGYTALLALRNEAERVSDNAWKKGERPYNTHIVHAVLHRFGPQPHQPQDRLRTRTAAC